MLTALRIQRDVSTVVANEGKYSLSLQAEKEVTTTQKLVWAKAWTTCGLRQSPPFFRNLFKQ